MDRGGKTNLGEQGRDDLDLFTLGRLGVLPIHEHRGRANHGRHVHVDIVLPDAAVRAGAKHEPVLRVLVVVVDASRHPSLGHELFRVGVHLFVVERVPERRDEHRALGNRVLVVDRERLLGQVRHHDDGGAVAQDFLRDGVRVRHLFEERERHGRFVVSVSHRGLFLAHLGEHLGMVREELERERDR